MWLLSCYLHDFGTMYVLHGVREQEFYYIFFFKQKTAYEMRISDWSSDVCSSDLRDAEPAREADPPGDAQGQPAAPPDGVQCDPKLFVQSVHWGAGPWVQLGRASCRERVCQYV